MKLASTVSAAILVTVASTLSVTSRTTDRFVLVEKASKAIPTSLATRSAAEQTQNANQARLV